MIGNICSERLWPSNNAAELRHLKETLNLKKVVTHRKMGQFSRRHSSKKGHLSCLGFALLLLLSPIAQLISRGQGVDGQVGLATSSSELFRIEKLAVAGGAELITIHGRLQGLQTNQEWTPLVSVLRDTLGDSDPENDRLRYVWPLSYTRPGMAQRIAGAIPFFYARVGNKHNGSDSTPPPVMDLAAPDKQVWEKIFWSALQTLLLDPYGMPIKASTYSYRRNLSDYRRSQIVRALSVLSLYQAVGGTPAFSESEMSQIQSRLLLTDKTFGGLVDEIHLEGYHERRRTEVRDVRGHNWELLRQRAEAESLIFEPLEMPDGSTTHAMLWIAKDELVARPDQKYDARFLNISNPRSDARLKKWNGYVETRFFDSENRAVAAATPGARSVEMIPLALYGLDNPKIPVLLVDFRDTLNPKKREMSRRVLKDVTRNFVSLSGAGGMAFFLGRTAFDFATGRRGMDINQPSRLRTYSQLKLLLTLNDSLEPGLRHEINARLEKVSLNPLENDLAAEVKLSQQQYQLLKDYAQKPTGLPAILERDRRAELVPLKHNKAEQILFKLGNILSFGKYTHRENSNPEMETRLDVARRVAYHTRFLRQVARSSARVEVVWNLEDVRRSLRFIADHGGAAGSAAPAAAAAIFLKTADEETRLVCLDSLARITSRRANDELLRITKDKHLEVLWKDRALSYLRSGPSAPLAASGNKSRTERAGQQ